MCRSTLAQIMRVCGEALLKTKDLYEFEQLDVVHMDISRIKALEGRNEMALKLGSDQRQRDHTGCPATRSN